MSDLALGKKVCLTTVLVVNRIKSIMILSGGRMIKIMLIEDDFDNRELLAECLRLESYEVFAYENGKVALENLNKNNPPDMLLMDLSFPIITAEEFVNSFRAQIGNETTPIIILSGKPDIKTFAAKLKARCFLPKPYDLYRLYNEIASAVSHLAEENAA